MAELNVNVPVDPRPVLVTVSDRCFGELSYTVEPCRTIVETDFDTLYFVAATVIGIAGNTIRVAFSDTGKLDTLAMSGFRYD